MYYLFSLFLLSLVLISIAHSADDFTSKMLIQVQYTTYANAWGKKLEGSCKVHKRPTCTPKFELLVVMDITSNGKQILNWDILEAEAPINSINFVTDLAWKNKRSRELYFELNSDQIKDLKNLRLQSLTNDIDSRSTIEKVEIYAPESGFGNYATSGFSARGGGFTHFEYRFVCQENYYGTACNRYCVSKKHGICDSDGNLACEPGYLAPDCEKIDPCFVPRDQGPRCMNQGKCIADESLDQFHCKCADGFLGDRCQYEDPCKIYQGMCQHGGTCSAQLTPDGVTTGCECPKSYKGVYCEERDYCYDQDTNLYNCIDRRLKACSSLPEKDTYQCTCRNKKFGLECDQPNPCRDTPCKNNGECQFTQNKDNEIESITCKCKPGFTGQFCQYSDYSSTLPSAETTTEIHKSTTSTGTTAVVTTTEETQTTRHVQSTTTEATPKSTTATPQPVKPFIPSWVALCPDHRACVIVYESKLEDELIEVQFKAILEKFLESYTHPTSNKNAFEVKQINVQHFSIAGDWKLEALSFEIIDESGSNLTSEEIYQILFNDSIKLHEFEVTLHENLDLDMYDPQIISQESSKAPIIGYVFLTIFLVGSLATLGAAIHLHRNDRLRTVLGNLKSRLSTSKSRIFTLKQGQKSRI